MTRLLFAVAAAVSALLCGAACVLWGRRYRHAPGDDDHISWVQSGSRYTVRSMAGRLTLYAPPPDVPLARRADGLVQDKLIRELRNEQVIWIAVAADPDFRRSVNVHRGAI